MHKSSQLQDSLIRGLVFAVWTGCLVTIPAQAVAQQTGSAGDPQSGAQTVVSPSTGDRPEITGVAESDADIDRMEFHMLDHADLVHDAEGRPIGVIGARGTQLWTLVDLVAQPAIQRELRLSDQVCKQIQASREEKREQRWNFWTTLLYHRHFRDRAAAVRRAWTTLEALDREILEPLSDAQIERAREIHAWCVLRMAGPIALARMHPDLVSLDPQVARDETLQQTLEDIWNAGLERAAELWAPVCERILARARPCLALPPDTEFAFPDPESTMWPEILAICLDEDEAADFARVREILNRTGPDGFDELLSYLITV